MSGTGRARTTRALAAAALLLAAGTPTAVHASRIITTPHPRQVVALSPSGGRPDVLRRIDNGEIFSPAASANGGRIAFIVHRDKRRAREDADVFVLRDEVWTMRGDGSGVRPIASFVRKRRGNRFVFPPPGTPGGRGALESLDISDDGSRLVIARGPSSLYTLDLDGGGLRHVRTSGARPQGYIGSDCCGPQFFPGGRRIIGHFAVPGEKEGMATVPVSGGRVRFIHPYGFSPTYSDDGRRIAFVATLPPPKGHPNREGEWAIWMMRADGSHVRLVLRLPGSIVSNPDFSPNGSHLAFAVTYTPERLIALGVTRTYTYVARTDGSHLRRVGSGLASFNYDNPQWVR